MEDGTFLKTEFDWDAIDVGDYLLDHSQNFFAKANKENIGNINNVNALLTCATPVAKADQDQYQTKNEEAEIKPIPIIQPSWDEDELKEENRPEADQHQSTENRCAPGPNLRLMWSPVQQKHQTEPAAGGSVPIPKAYDFKNVYESNRQLALRRREDEERKAREFHSRPMPNFKMIHNRIGEMRVVHKVTMPVTPEVVKHGRLDRERRRIRETGSEHDKHPPPRPGHCQPKPFQLRSEQRLRERREFDAAVQANLEQKKNEQDEQRKRCEQEEIKEIRKMTVFKARPNPFK
ncbi:targeting protein for Xklp2-like isoform X2 [Drosophila bipectinata]|uniref:targeting protein for Xklp2-like isoform X2 n=1 Tax=Drosophila bipectinata TaxID=42026 RepID=UPI001C8943F2|nr:uncharacterized protein LOC108119703 isoform X2 [Drosophila bipectinata]